MNRVRFSSFLLLMLFTTCVFAQPLIHGNGALEVFDAQGMMNSPQWVQIWVAFMLVSFACSLFFVRKHVIARWVLGGFVLGALAMLTISAIFNIPNFSGYIATFHLVFWSPALFQLIKHRPFLGAKTPFTIWSGVMTVVILFSFVFDIRDAYIYLNHVL